MRPALIIPIKSYRRAKQRLESLLTEEEREHLARTMADDVLRTVSRLSEYTRLVVSDDLEVLALARGFGLEAIEDQLSQGQSAAVRQGFESAAARGFSTAATIPGDVPGVSQEELREFCEFNPEVEVLLSPDWEAYGTNGLRLIPPDAIELRFGEDSLRLHRAEAAQHNRSFEVKRFDGLACDLDRPADISAFMKLGRKTATLELLQQVNVLERLAARSI
jgi:2-phospho-L-lactate guanylyltransferase